jgi:hypothetical protein
MSIKLRVDVKEFKKVMDNVIEYSEGFLKETEAKTEFIASKLGRSSVKEFYRYLDSLAATNPEMLHHVYEWGAVGNPSQRLFALTSQANKKSAQIISDFLESNSISDTSKEPFFDKARIMEAGIPLVINNVNAQALFFEVGGEEIFAVGPIYIPNPGGEMVRGQFKAQFEEFYNNYFTQVYLRAIRFYDHFKTPKPYYQGFAAGSRAGGKAAGRASALKWILDMPGEE